MEPENDQAQRRTEHDQGLSFRTKYCRHVSNDNIFILRQNVLKFIKVLRKPIFSDYI